MLLIYNYSNRISNLWGHVQINSSSIYLNGSSLMVHQGRQHIPEIPSKPSGKNSKVCLTCDAAKSSYKHHHKLFQCAVLWQMLSNSQICEPDFLNWISCHATWTKCPLVLFECKADFSLFNVDVVFCLFRKCLHKKLLLPVEKLPHSYEI